TQGVGRIPFDVTRDHVHLASLTGHKIHGPQGCGALYVRRRDPEVRLVAQTHGGSQERGLRAGTLNVPGIVGLGAACELCRIGQEEEAVRLGALRDRLRDRLAAGVDGIEENGDPRHRLPNNLHVSIRGVENTTLMMAVPKVAVSSGSACASGEITMSHVMLALGAARERAGSSIRFGLGRFTTEAEIDEAADRFVAAIRKLRG
ncbi:MAG: aminotransferase class V-fold PLP-dependent enzyme, partial [Planctomycetota bacterium]|nr:aminotransferase class V-fold PLP-dependent enzyme [Planctomycetota bacterium]